MTGESSTAEEGDSTPSVSRTTSETEAAGGSEERPENGDVTRRAFMRATGATAAGAAGIAASDDASAQAQTYRFGGEVQAWQGREPAEIEGESNPTIELEAGQEYEFWFENLDGAPHNIAMRDADGNVIVQSDNITQEGATTSVTFTATSQMAEYICTIHPTTMVGDLNVTGEAGGESGISLRLLLLAGGVVLAFISPLLFALFLFSRGGDRGGGATARS
jgi:hypothetical protein